MLLEQPAADPLTCGFDVNIGGHAAGAMGSYSGCRGYGADREDAEIWQVPMPNTDCVKKTYFLPKH